MNNSDDISPFLEIQRLSKSFPGTVALDEVSLNVCRGEIHSLMGENGAGKSTLMKILAGIYQKDSGQILLNGQPVEIQNERQALQSGIAMVHQELNNFPEMTVAENIFAGREPSRLGMVKKEELNSRAGIILQEFHLNIDPHTKMGMLSISEMQLVEIVKAISCNAAILILDEPTSAISSIDADFLFEVLQRLKKQGVAIIYISHKMEEVFRISDRITVLRDGKWISTGYSTEITRDELIHKMVGRELKELFPDRTSIPGDTVLEVKNLSRQNAFIDISLSVRKGEVLGIAGLVGSGRSEFIKSIFGFPPADSGEILVMGKRVHIHSPGDAMNNGFALVPEDRKLAGLNLLGTVMFNTTLAVLPRFAGFGGMIHRTQEKQAAGYIASQLQVKSGTMNQLISNLSGGNQQKVVLAKWLLVEPSVLLLDEPTRGIDIGAKSEIYQLINKLAMEGMSILMVSSEMTELMGLCERIIAFRKGKISREFDRSGFNQEHILAAIMN
ncbi:MAG: sugar ABC transporter ATP-binding protein [Porphyromonadaceae bacterium]|nr:MAG: sugar ABC transporter ATP-binding protein [Porphyromonadaceae bacterium]